jgi:signal transduction histidine kinase/CheY-like chemotaxis protein/serine phosphatase RsbU (regulator of sigma subunit)
LVQAFERGDGGTGLREWLAGAGETGHDLLAVDWAATPLGPIESWPAALGTIVRVLVSSRFSMWMAWGEELTFFCNEAYRRDTLGRKYPWALGRPAREVWAEIWPDIGPRIATVLRTGQATWDEGLLLFLERSGYEEETYHTFSYSPLSDEQGRIAGMLCVVSEETERVIGERRLATLRDLGAISTEVHEEGAFLEAAAAALAHNRRSLPFAAIYLFEPDGAARLAATCGIERGHPAVPERLSPEGQDPVWPIGRILREGAAQVIVDLSGARFAGLPVGAWPHPPKQAAIAPLLDPGGGPPFGFLVAGINRYRPLDAVLRSFYSLIAQRLAAGVASARAYAAERDRAEQLAALDRAKTAFFSNVSHELRTPLTLMLAPLEDALTEDRPMDPEAVELVHRNGLRLLKLVGALLDFSRLEAGRLRPWFRPTDVGALTTELVGTFREACDRAGIALKVEVRPVPGEVYLDPDLWERIVLNLVSNAFKFTPAGAITVTLGPGEDARSLSVSVADTGIGIPSAELERIFERFHRVTTPEARSHEGTGIGLSLVRELVELHGGRIEVESRLGSGSRFTVTIPLGREHLPDDQVSDVPADTASGLGGLFAEEAGSWMPADVPQDEDLVAPFPRASGNGSGPPGPRVLVADDNPDLRRYLTRLLSRFWRVEAVANGREALRRALECPPDLLLTDVMMPELDGFELVARLRDDPRTRELPIIVLSARAGEAAKIEGLGAGADDYLSKPFSGRELLARVRSHLDLSLVRRQAGEEVDAQRRLLEQTLRQLPAGVVLSDARTGRTVIANEQVERILGHPVPNSWAISGRNSGRMLDLDRRPLELEEIPLVRATRRGEVVQDMRVLYRRPDGCVVTILFGAAPVTDESGEIIAGVVVFQDISARVRDERLLARQRDILAMVARGAPLRAALAEIVATVEELSELDAVASIMLLEEDGRRLGRTVAPRLPVDYVAAIDDLPVGEGNGSCGTAAHRRQSVVVADTLQDPLWSKYRELAERFGLRACWSVPIFATDGELVGTFAVYHQQTAEPTAEDEQVVELLSRTAAVAIERDRDARAREREIRARQRQLRELQTSLLPPVLPVVAGLQTAASFHPGDRSLEVGGDFYDLFELDEEAWGFVIGDVCGHGAEAAAVTALTRHTTRAVARLIGDPAAVLADVSDSLLRSGYDRFCTAAYGRLGRGSRGCWGLSLVIGGHPAPLLRRAAGVVESFAEHGPALGIVTKPAFPTLHGTMSPGDTLFLYTDGLIERNPLVEGEEGLAAIIAGLPAESSASEQLSALEAAALGPAPLRNRDDVAILVLRATQEG